MVDGAEVLVRWLDKERGIVKPNDFIPIFERNGFITKLDYYVWEHTCMMLRRWLDSGRKICPVSVNISRVNLYNPKLADVICGLVSRYSIPVELLQLELTESAYANIPELMKTTMGWRTMLGICSIEVPIPCESRPETPFSRKLMKKKPLILLLLLLFALAPSAAFAEGLSIYEWSASGSGMAESYMMGKNYDAAVLAAGHCGFGLGATPTAIANMALVRIGPSVKRKHHATVATGSYRL